jgi:ATP-dependent exoDNAse (exonuclease V) beta subunit
MKFIEKENLFSLTDFKNVEKYPYKRYSRAEDPETGQRMYAVDGSKLPSVTTILGATKDQESIEALERWKKQKGADVADRIKNEASTRGTEMHLVIEKYIQGQGYLNLTEQGNQARRMAHTILKNCNDITEVWGNEISLAYPEKYAGATDLVGVADGKVTLFDWKQTNKPKRQEWSVVQDYFTQLAAYSLAHEKIYGPIEVASIRMCSKDFYYQEFKVEGDDLKRYQDKWWERYEKYLSQTVTT